MDSIEVTVLSDDGEHTTRSTLNQRHIIAISEVHETMINTQDLPKGAQSLILVRGFDSPIPVSDSYDELTYML
jgi:hypothetical protein